MTTLSPYLEGLLTRWGQEINAIDKDAAFQKELIDPVALAAHGNRMAMRERRRRDLRQLDHFVQEARMRWDERLSRVEEWKIAGLRLQEEESRLNTLLQASVWLEKARTYQESFIQRLDRGAVRLEAGTQLAHDNLQKWHAVLNEREIALHELLSKSEQTEGPFYVSRARKQPEIDFLQEQTRIAEDLGDEVAAMRHFLNHLRGRLRKALTTIEQRTYGAEIFHELHKQELLSALESMEVVLEKRREEILSEALVYESGRHLLRKLKNIVDKLPCLEDIPQSKSLFGRWSTR